MNTETTGTVWAAWALKGTTDAVEALSATVTDPAELEYILTGVTADPCVSE